MESLKLGADVLESAYTRLANGFFGREGAGMPPVTFAAAQSEVARREEDRKAKEEVRREARSKERKSTHALPARQINKGCLIGGRREDLSPWWMVMEDYFRPVLVEDLLAALPDRASLDPLTDPAFRVPRVGQDVDLLDEGDFWESGGCPQQEEGVAEGRKPSGNVHDDSRGTAQRRSHRLASKKLAREGSFGGGHDTVYWEDTTEMEQYPPWLNMPQSQEDNACIPATHLLGLCNDEDLELLVSHIELSKGKTSNPESQILEAAEMVESGSLHGERSELLDKLDKELQVDLLVDIISSSKFGPMQSVLDAEVDTPEDQKEENGVCEKGDQRTKAESCTSAAAGPSESGNLWAPQPPCSAARDILDPLHPCITTLFNQSLPAHVFKCPSTPRTIVPEPRVYEAPKSLGTGSPATPIPEQNASSRDLDSRGTPVAESAEMGQTPFKFPELSDQNNTPVFQARVNSRCEDANDRNGLMAQSAPTLGYATCDIRGTSTRRKRLEVDYSALAGRTVPSSANNVAGKRKAYKCGTGAHAEVVANPTLAAVQSAIAEGGPDGSLEDQWHQLDIAKQKGVLESAPDDEIMADIVACQSELLQQSAANRARLKKSIGGALEERPKMLEEMAHKERMEQDIVEFVRAISDNRRDKQREKRELSRKQNSEKAGVGNPARGISPRISCPPRPFHIDADTQPSNNTRKVNQFSEIPEKMVDPLAVRDANGDAVCAVCGQSHCDPTNVIVFCDRCNLAVHQECYGMADVPEGEWLCWPCMVFEEKLQKNGVPMEGMVASCKTENPSVIEHNWSSGGSRMVDCALCPVKWGAFKLSTDKLRWVHVACCHAHRETSLLPGNICEAVEGLQDIPNSRWNVSCDICHRKEGAVLRCAQGNCSKSFHFLCARRVGLASMRPSQRLGQTCHFACSVHCKNHDALRKKEAVSPAAATKLAARQKDKSKAKGPTVHTAETPQPIASFQPQPQSCSPTCALPPNLPGKYTDRACQSEVNHFASLASRKQQKALESLEEKKKDFEELYKLRIDLEGVRLLCAECKRRERFKVFVATSKLNKKNVILGDIPKYVPFIETIFPGQRVESLGIQEQEAVPITTVAASTPEQETPMGSLKRGRPVGPRSTRGAQKQAESDSFNDAPKTSGRKLARGNQGRAKKQMELTQFFETAEPGDVQVHHLVQSEPAPLRGRSTRATTRVTRSTAISQSAVQECENPEVVTVPSRNEPGPSRQPQIESVIESSVRTTLGKRSRSRRGAADDVRQILAPERALTGEEAQEINFEIRSRGYVFVRNDKMEVDKECEQSGQIAQGTSAFEQ